MKNNIEYQEIPGASGAKVPILEGARYKVYGMGKSKVDVEQRQAFFYGNSLDYGIGINARHLESIRQLASDWKIDIR